jgi:two-component system, OmpR family, sensor kinase
MTDSPSPGPRDPASPAGQGGRGGPAGQGGQGGSGFWRTAAALPGRTPLRVKLITAVLALVAIALAVISITGITVLKSYLLGQTDSGLHALAPKAEQAVAQYLGGLPPVVSNVAAVAWIRSGGKLRQVDAYGIGPAFGEQNHMHVLPGPRVPATASWLAANSGRDVTVPAQSGSGHWRVLLDQASFQTPDGGTISGTVIVGQDVSSVYATTGRLIAIDLVVSTIVLLGLAIVGIAVVRASLRPLTDIERTAETIAAGDLTRRVPDRDPRTEVGRLGRSLNAMLAQIETAFRARAESEAAARRSEERMRQFVADASHELRTPLTAIRGFAEYYRQRGGVDLTSGGAARTEPAPGAAAPGQAAPGQAAPGQAAHGAAAHGDLAGSGQPAGGNGSLPPADLDRIMRRVEQESARMGVLVEDMLLLARLEQQRPLDHRTVDLLTLAADAVHDARVVAPERSINLTVSSGAALLVMGDEVRLRQVIGNLLSNALVHTPDKTPIDVRLRPGSFNEGTPHPAAAAAPPVPAPAEASPVPGRPASPAPASSVPASSVPGGPVPASSVPGGPVPGRPGGPAPASPVPAAPPPQGPRSAAVLEVADHGPGLTPAQAERAFERFYRADKARTSGGTGLGLAIVAALVAAHGGRVWVDSPPAGGAIFRIALPLAPEALDHDPEQDHPGHEELDGG